MIEISGNVSSRMAIGIMRVVVAETDRARI
jgi:hypothetical protein